jgi:hypothetical protein
MTSTIFTFLVLTLFPAACFINLKTWRTDFKQWGRFLIFYTLFIAAYMTFEKPDNVMDDLFGLNENSTCEDYNNAKLKYQVDYVTQCQGLSGDQCMAMADNPSAHDAAVACFLTEMKTCRGWEKISKIFRACVAGSGA